ncbi:hypothetical protein AFI02nite_41970 [Aliivibrio fischeri]|uniref:Uncharacterized protein n=1 Tax=Aliivibrio fischeri TaxID=668 RepID=A0A510URR4_ALIFS|nr:hypothetical protein AFI02nite_41970 [Aliivibrio fischeri]
MSCEDWKIKEKKTILCSCESWKIYIERYSLRLWPIHCSVKDCNYAPNQGVPVINRRVDYDKVIPVCDSCAARTGYFDIKGSVSLIDIKRYECRVRL